ncbi:MULTISPECIES: hypothetical protein [unclassified Blastococcus]|nr:MULTISPECIES: hypothetical protein [unclassified Blastococcus]
MTVAARVLGTCPADLGGVDGDELRSRAEACRRCEQACRGLISTPG